MTKHKSRWLAGLMAAVMLFTCLTVPIPAQTTASAHWADTSLTKLRDWGVMRGDQNGSMEPDRNITRAEFVSMVNRAFGYKKLGKQPFKDVAGGEWYANEINIAYNQGYFKGSSKSTASPNDSLTREEAAVLVGRNLMLTPDESENMIFKDGRTLSSWSRGIVTAAAKKGILKGQEDGTFRPQAPITRGEVASMLERTIGTPVNQSGRRSLGMVRGNVMISAPDVELYDTVINGDLYITAGVDLGFVKLDNVRVTGQIIAAGAGVSNRDGNSITLHNTSVAEMIIDSPNNVAISVRAEGDTKVGKAFVRTSAYLEDSCYNGNGFQVVEIDGEEGTRVDFTGNFKDVILKTPKGMVALGRGSIKKLSVDEKAFGAMVNIDIDAFINEMYLDTGTTVTGAGDVGYVKINTAGTTMTMLPDKIEIRPGITATIGGTQMDSNDAVLASSYPRILAGYPKIRDVAPNTANSLVSTNKTGTMYWGITYKADKEISTEDLIKPPAYGGKALSTGQSSIRTVEDDITTAISGLKTDTEYTFSAVLKDARGNISARKSRSFRTPDNTIPNFAPGYPRVDKDGYVDDDHSKDFYTAIEAVITKNSTLYYALYNKGLPAPTADELRTQTMTGQVKGANGKLEVKKNEPIIFPIMGLKEQTEYDLYLLASDGINHSPVRKLSFKTGDHTPPEFNDGYPKADNAKERSVDVAYNVSEDATVYWVAVKRGETYPVPPDDWEGGEVPLDSDEAKSQVMNGSNAKFKGRTNAVKDREGRLTIGGLEIQTGYDVYFVLQDKAGNLIEEVKTLQIKTLDVIPPTAELKFDPEVNGQPLVESDISIVFSEEIRVEVDEDGKRKSLHEMEGEELLDAVRRNFQFIDAESQLDDPVPTNFNAQNVICKLEEGKTILTFKGGEDEAARALNLVSGNKYRVEMERGIYDTSNNRIEDEYRVLEFTTVFSRIVQNEIKDRPADLNVAFELRPQSTKVSDNIYFDLILWSESDIEFKLFEKKNGQDNWNPTKNYEGDDVVGAITKNGAISVYSLINDPDDQAQKFPKLKDVERISYGIQITKLNGRPAAEGNEIVNIYSVPVAGNFVDLDSLSKNPAKNWETLVGGSKVILVGTPPSLHMYTVLTDTMIPQFIQGSPTFDKGDSIVIPQVQVDRKATLYYVVAPKDSIVIQPTPTGKAPESGADPQPAEITNPTPQDIMRPGYAQSVKGAVQGSFAGQDGSGIEPYTLSSFEITGLQPKTEYDVFFVLKGTPQTPSKVHWYRLSTVDVATPDITLNNDIASSGTNKITVTVNKNANVWWKLYPANKLPDNIKNSQELKPSQQSDEFEIKSTSDRDGLAGIGNDIKGMNGTSDVIKAEGTLKITRPPTDTTTGDISSSIELKDLEEGQSYVMVALVQNVLGGKYRLYRLDDILPRDSTAPVIVSVSGAQAQGNSATGYSANVTILFSEPLYYKKPNDFKNVYPMGKEQFSPNTASNPDDQDKNIHMQINGQGTGMLKSVNPPAGPAYNMVIYQFTKWRIGDSMIFPQQIADENGEVAGIFTLTLEQNRYPDKDGNLTLPGFVARLGNSVKPDPYTPPQQPQRP
ncbi:MAG: S-layer homology domain-containing protein [Butyricicoccus pullicaecorum]|nr:S-layer homology domain-containing protein [Butyricicoccus pullicaecorum]